MTDETDTHIVTMNTTTGTSDVSFDLALLFSGLHAATSSCLEGCFVLLSNFH